MGSKLNLLPGEHEVMSSDQGILTLTNKRIRYASEVSGQSMHIGITLDSIASCGIISKSYPLLLVLGALAGIGALAADRNFQSSLFVVAAVLIVTFFLSRKTVISIASNGGDKILIPAKGMEVSEVYGVLEAIEREKLNFVNLQKS